jgi:hypothetical protein
MPLLCLLGFAGNIGLRRSVVFLQNESDFDLQV